MLPRSGFAWQFLAVTGVGLAGLAGLACSGGSSSSSGTPRPTLTMPPPGPSPMIFVSTGEVPFLTAEQREVTEKIINDDPALLALAGDSGISIDQLGPYLESGKDNRDILVGTTTRVTLTEPRNVTDLEVPQSGVRSHYGFWPDELQARYSPWMDRKQVISVRNLTQFDVDVDLIRRRVVAVWVYSIDYLDQELTRPTPYTDPIFAGERRSRTAESIAMDHPAASAVFDALDARPRGSYEFEIGAHRFAYVTGYSDDLFPASGDWPVLVDQDPETGDYRSETVYVSGNAANTVWVTVDLDTRTVIDISTSERD